MTFWDWWCKYEETDNYLNGATNESTVFEAWHARDVEIERLTKQRDALLGYARREEELDGTHWQITPESEELRKKRHAALKLCSEEANNDTHL